VWIAVGGTPQSVVRAATLGLPLALAIIGGLPENFVPFVDLYRETGERLGVDPSKLKVSINSHTFVGETSQAAADAFYPSYSAVMTRIGKERGWPPSNRQQFDASRTKRGALLVGSAQEVIDKILYQHSLFHHDRFMAQMDVGAVPHRHVMKSLELLGTQVAPAVRQAVGP
jgi:alkanesulfonate monooxygenase SsuD/methylene tetrahydromethanopterin reductase-like flavin-dependent oxidoreductase (luciferase family)